MLDLLPRIRHLRERHQVHGVSLEHGGLDQHRQQDVESLHKRESTDQLVEGCRVAAGIHHDRGKKGLMASQ